MNKPPVVGNTSIKVSCHTCRKIRPAIDCMHYVCKHLNGGMPVYFNTDEPCVHWMPSRRAIKVALARREEADDE